MLDFRFVDYCLAFTIFYAYLLQIRGQFRIDKMKCKPRCYKNKLQNQINPNYLSMVAFKSIVRAVIFNFDSVWMILDPLCQSINVKWNARLLLFSHFYEKFWKFYFPFILPQNRSACWIKLDQTFCRLFQNSRPVAFQWTA